MIYVLDSSAVLAAMNGERGGDKVLEADRGSEISTVNVAEVFTTLIDAGIPCEEVEKDFYRFEFRIRNFRDRHAMRVGQLRPLTRDFGLSLGDRACLAQSAFSSLPILTADHRMADAAVALGINIHVIRERRD